MMFNKLFKFDFIWWNLRLDLGPNPKLDPDAQIKDADPKQWL
jgi:hypothetical protein